MRVARTVSEVRAAVQEARSAGRTVGFVPTMGFLHEGHLSLFGHARAGGADFLVASIFVNPTQFGPKEDFATYPRDEQRDAALLEDEHVDLLFLPTVEVMYPDGFQTTITTGAVAEPLEGARRPGHFAGVATVVLKLFNIVEPDLAVFGQKDAQQCAVIRQMVRDLDLDVRLLFAPTVRENDSLAQSSRNTYLTSSERIIAPSLFRALSAGERVLRDGGSADEAERAMHDSLSAAGEVTVDYLRVVDSDTFQPPSKESGELLLVGAVHIGRTRLIDNIRFSRTNVRQSHDLLDSQRASG